MRRTSGKSTGEFPAAFRGRKRKNIKGKKEDDYEKGRREKIVKRGTLKGAKRTMRSSEGQRGADKMQEVRKRSRKKGNVSRGLG